MRSKIECSLSPELISVDFSAKLEEAYQIMRNNWIRHLPVTNSWSEIVGILSDRDLMRAANSQIYASTPMHWEKLEFDPQRVVGDYMTSPVRSFDSETATDRVIVEMISTKTSAFLITKDAKVIGIVTTEDMLKLLHHILQESGSRWPAKLENFFLSPLVQRTSQMVSDMGI
ncbi:MAG: CBS domain-containing protein [Pseudobdellovibrionaceae bacterium]